MGRFDYWKRGRRVRSLSIKVPKNSNKPLVYFQIIKGCFDESPYWDQALQEETAYQAEVLKYRAENPKADEESVMLCMQPRRATYTKRIRKLKEAHIDYEDTRLAALKRGLIAAFKVDHWELALEECEGGPKELYHTYEALVPREAQKIYLPFTRD